MNGMVKKLAGGLLTLALFAAFLPVSRICSYAAAGKLTFSDPTVTVGNEVAVTMKIAATDGTLGRSNVMLEYDTDALEFVSGTNANGGAGQVRVTGTMETANQTTFSFSLRFKAIRAGSTTIRVVSQEVYDADDQTVTLSHVGTSTVTANASSSASTDAGLSSLTISPGTLSPAFSSDITEYTATVYGDTTSVTVSAPARDAAARVAVSGNETIELGDNTVVCTVTAEDGTTRTYTITVTKLEGEEPVLPADAEGEKVNIAVDEGNWQVADTFDESMLPEGFTPSEYEYNGETVRAGIDERGNVLLYMTDENGNGDFFFYDTETNTLSQYVTVLMAEKTIMVLSPDMIPEDVALPDGFVPCNIDIGNHTVHGWIWQDHADAPEYCVLYGMNADGERNFYRYDQKEMTLQRYFPDPDAESLRAQYLALATEHNSLIEDYNTRGKMIVGLFAGCIVLVIVIIILLLVRRPKNPYDGARERYRAPSEDDDFVPEKKGGRNAQPDRRAVSRSGEERDVPRKSDASQARRFADTERDAPRKGDASQARRSSDTERGPMDTARRAADMERRSADAARRLADTDRRPERTERNAAEVEKDIAATLAKEAAEARAQRAAEVNAQRAAAAGSKKPEPDFDDDDFEFIDLDL